MTPLRLRPHAIPGGLRASALAVAMALALPAAPLHAQDADPVVARVNGTDVRTSDLSMVEEDLGSNLPAMSPEAKRDYLVTFYADMVMIAKAAEGKKLGDTPEFQRRLAYQRTKLLMEQHLQAEAKSSVTDQAMRQLYDDATKQMKSEQEVRARHILVETEDEAKAVLAELKKGADFADLAKTKSKDPSAKQEGGDLGYFTKQQMVPEFSEVAFRLDKGQLSDPVKSQFGWHVIRVEDKRDRQPPGFDQVKEQLESYLTRKAQGDMIAKLRAEAKIERLDKKPEAPAPEGQKKD
ncbi:MAG: peptidylprolyl isomerase [Xanthobacteraceae bacterium]|nr:peptidylprolyl isomerase [Xanthobacteraceae bacterium]PWB57983.1 MAG: peptidylprolyl isomerase [Bradyrhizobiaceae bacterium]